MCIRYRLGTAAAGAPVPPGAPLRGVFAARLAERLAYAAGERDAVLLEHEAIAEWRGEARAERVVWTLALAGGGAAGEPSAMARTVGLTAALGVKLLLRADARAALGGGVHVPTRREVYEAVLPLLAAEGVRFGAKRRAALPLNVAY